MKGGRRMDRDCQFQSSMILSQMILSQNSSVPESLRWQNHVLTESLMAELFGTESLEKFAYPTRNRR